MKKRTFSLLVICIAMMLLLTPAIAFAADETSPDGNFEYRVQYDGTVRITKYIGTDTYVTIPEEINGSTVTDISYNTFARNTSVTGVVIPDTVTKLDSSAFYKCTNLSEVTLSNSITSIPYSLFQGCTSLLSIKIPDSVTAIDSYAFSGCTSLAEISIGAGVTKIGYLAFEDTAWLSAQQAKTPLVIVNNILIDGTTASGNAVIPNGITCIPNYAFRGNKNLVSITIPNSVTDIGSSAFVGCSSLESVSLPNSIESLPDSLFESCTKLKNVSIPNTVTSIKSYAFAYCPSLETLTIPSSVTSIGYGAFYGCNTLASIVIPNSVTNLDNSIFRECSSLKSVTLPDGITEINGFMFDYCESLKSIDIPDTVTSIGEFAFFGCHDLSEVKMSSNVTSIGQYAFDDCNFSSITLPKSLKSIGRYAFYSCDNLTDVYYTGTESEWEAISIDDNNYSLTGANIHSVEDYNVWVGNVQVTIANCSDVLGDGKVSFDPETNTLTLNGAQIKGSHGDGEYSGAIYAGTDLTVKVIGASSITPDSADANGIFTNGNLTLTGSKNLIITTEESGIFVAYGNAAINMSGNLNITSADDGILADYTVDISGSGSVIINSQIKGISTKKLTLGGSSSLSIISVNDGIDVTQGATFSTSGNININSDYFGIVSRNNVTLSGSGTVTIFGKKCGVRLSGANSRLMLDGTNSPITITTEAGNKAVYNKDSEYSVTGTNYNIYTETGSTEDNSITYTFAARPVISTQPKSQQIVAGATAKFQVVATGSSITYQWQKSSNSGKTWTNCASASAKSATFSFTMREDLDGYQYRCIVTDAYGQSVTSNAAAANVVSAPVITTQPKSQTIAAGATAKFQIVATGSGLTYQWQKSSNSGKTWTNCSSSSAKSATFSFTMREDLNGYQYRCIVTDAYGQTVTSSAATAKVASGPVITTQPKTQTIAVGATAKFQVVATGSGLTYQWQKSSNSGKTWTNCTSSSAKTATFSFTMREDLNNYQYRCIVTDANGQTVTSSAATAKVASGPVITTQPKTQTIAVGSTAKFQVAATGSGLTYQWQKSSNSGKTWTNCSSSSAKSATFSFTMREDLNNYQYRCIVTDANGQSVTSSAATAKAASGPVITTQPKSQTIAAGSTAKFQVVASGSGLTYQWQKSSNSGKTWTNCSSSSAKSATFTFTMREDLSGYQYRCIVTDANGQSVTSSAATAKTN